MKIKKILAVLLVVSTFALSATACGTSAPTVSTSSMTSTESAVLQSSEIQSSSSILKGSFDYDEVCQNIRLNNKVIPVPFSVNDLGKGYSIDYDNTFYTSNSDGTVNVAFDINYNGAKVLDAHIHNLPVEYKNENKNLDGLIINVFTQDRGEAGFLNKHLLSIDGICLGDDISKIVQQFGESENTTTDATGGGYRYYKNSNRKYGVTFFYEGSTVFSIMFKYNMHI